MSATEAFKQTFFQECDELLSGLEGRITALRRDAGNVEALHAAFRAIHTIKGGAGMFGFRRLVTFAHVFENVLDRMRAGEIAPDDATLDTIMQATDVLSDLIQAVRSGSGLAEHFDAEAIEQLSRLAASSEVRPLPEAALAKAFGLARYFIAFRPKPELLQRASEPLLILRQLQEIGRPVVSCDMSGLPRSVHGLSVLDL